MFAKCVYVFAAILFVVSHASAQTVTDTIVDEPREIVEPNELPVFTYVERMPEFPGGQQAMIRYLTDNVFYPDSARAKGISGKVIIRFIVDKEGSVRKPEVLRGVSKELDEEALRVVRGMPRWTPGMQNGRNVDVYFNLPISFWLE